MKTNNPGLKGSKNASDMSMLSQLVKLEPDFPCCFAHPDSTAAKPKLSLFIPTMQTYKLLLVSLFGKGAVLPKTFIGSIPTRLIRALLEKPKTGPLATLYDELYFVARQRPIEVIMPSVSAEYTKEPHGFTNLSDFMLTFHDLWHCWVASANNKGTILRLTETYQRKGPCAPKSKPEGFQMSVPTWNLVDMDIRDGSAKRADPHDEERATDRSAIFLSHLIADHCFKKSDGTQKPLLQEGKVSALPLIMLDDFYFNYEQWRDDFGFPEKTLQDFVNVLVEKARSDNQRHRFFKSQALSSYSVLQHCLGIMSAITHKVLDLGFDIPCLEKRILLYQVNPIGDTRAQQEELISLIMKLRVGLFFTWEKNGGLKLKKEFAKVLYPENSKAIRVDELIPKKLAKLLFKLLAVQEKASSMLVEAPSPR